jgi:hypothetical protein
MHVSCHIHSTWPNNSPSFLSSIILIISGGRHNLWSYKSCIFLQFPITFNHKILRTDQLCSPTHSTVFPECHNPSVTFTFMEILHKHTYTHVYISTVMFLESRKKSKTLQGCSSEHYSISFLLNFLILQYLFLNATPNYFKFPTFPNFQTMYQLDHVFLRCDIPVVPLEYTIRAKMWPVNAQLHCSNYKWYLHVSATEKPSSGCIREKYESKSECSSLVILVVAGNKFRQFLLLRWWADMACILI